MRVAETVISVCCVFVLLFEVFEVMLLPRRVRRRVGLVRFFFRTTWRVWSSAALRFAPGDKRETALTFYGPFSMVLLISFWMAGLIAAFGWLQFSLEPTLSFQRALYLSGATFFTLGSES